MFPLQGSRSTTTTTDELVIQILSNPSQQSKISNDLIMDYASIPKRILGSNNSNKNDDEEKTASAPAPAAAASPVDLKLRRIMHRDIERQRRREMSTLYSSLRSLLPLKYVKGKRSISDHMHEAVKYIKEMEANIKVLEKRRDLQIKSMPKSSSNETEKCSSNSSVTVSPWQGGLEILIGLDCKGQHFPISRVLRQILKQGFNVVSCVSTKMNQRSLYTIHTEACDLKCIDHLTALQQKVIDVINLDL